ncbi:MAG: hypothetical protein HY898_16745 [Deltaproteobacteria bacterium]|nr:hypothetical protein [Deltaproteobacteria bacterium]
MRTIHSTIATLALVAFGCGSAAVGPTPPAHPAPPAASSEGAPELPKGAAPGQLKLAHFASGNGMHGFVLDRTGAVVKIQIDGQKDIIELTPREDRHAGGLRGHYFDAPDGKAVIYIATSGGIRYFVGRDEFDMLPIRGALALGAPTIAGQPKHEKPAYEVFGEKLGPISVRKKFPQFTAEDASNLAKVAEVMDKADPSMFVRYVQRDPNGWLPRVVWVPSNISGIGYGGGSRESSLTWDKDKATGLAKFGGVLKGYSAYNSQGNHIFLQSMKGYPPNLATNTPGIVWEVDSTSVVFVTLDGGRYTVDISSSALEKGAPIEMGAGPQTQWPPALQHALTGIEEISALAKAGAVPQKVVEELSAQDDEWNACAQKVWKGAKPEFDKLHVTDMHYGTREGKVGQAVEKWEEKVRKDCKAAIDKQEKSLLAFIEQRNKERIAIFDKAKVKAGGK